VECSWLAGEHEEEAVRGTRRLTRALAGAVLVALAVAAPAARASVTTGRATVAQRSAGLRAAGATTVLPKGARRIPRAAAPALRTAAVPRAASSALAPTAAPLLANFDGVSSRDSEVTNFGQEFEPPDQGLCVGNGYVVEMVNSAYTVYRPNGTIVTGPFNINGPFDEGLIEFTTDPRCHYDAATDTWFATIEFISADSTRSHLDIAVNTTGDPTKLWKTYQIDTTHTGGPGCPCFGDQPTLGIDADNLYVTTNEFSILGPEFNGAQIYAIAKPDLVDQVDAPHFAHFGNLRIGGATATSVQPALTTGAAPAEFFLNSLDPNGTFDQRIGVWAITNRAAVAAGRKPTLTSVVLPSEAYAIPPGAEQKGTDSLIDAGDDRMQQTQYINGSVWGELGTTLTIPNDPQARAGAAWFEVRPTVGSTGLTAAKMRRQGYVGLTGNSLLYPALQTTPAGRTAMVVSLTGANRYPSAAYTVLAPGSSTFGPIRVAASGTTNYDPGAWRWGDYSWAVLSPSDASVAWLATEYVPPRARQTTDQSRNWGTRVFAVRP
jgi:hypothetical protein